MNFIFFKELLSSRALNALCWTLFHSLWEGALFAILAGLVMVLTKQSRSVLRYKLLSALFFLLTVCFTLTFLYELQNTAAINNSHATSYREIDLPSPAFQNSLTIPSPGRSSFSDTISDFLSRNESIIVASWLVILFVKSCRMVFVLGYTRYITRHKTHRPSQYWKMRMISLCHRLHIDKQVTLLESQIIKLPVVFGQMKPFILVPLGLLSQLGPEQVEAILIHELVHIRRNDYLVNLLQNIVETVFFFNPALLWLSSLIRDERENCCDDMVIAHTNNKKQYIESLIRFKELAMYNHSTASVAFAGRKSGLLSRITRIVENRNHSLNNMEKGTLICSAVIAVFLAMAFMAPKEIHHEAKIVLKKETKTIVTKMFSPGKALPGISTIQHPASKKISFSVKEFQKTVAQEIVSLATVSRDTLPFDRDEELISGFRRNIHNVIGDFISEHVVSSESDVKSFALDVNILEVNDQRQPEWLHKKLVEKYGIQKDLGWYYGPEKAIGRGFFIGDSKMDSLKYTNHEPNPKSFRNREENDSLKFILLQRRMDAFKFKDSLYRINYKATRQPRQEYKRPMEGESAYSKINQIMGQIIGDLILAGVIHDRESVSFNLCNKELMVNGKVQPESLHKQLLDKYVVPCYKMFDNASNDPDFGFHIDLRTGSSGLGFYKQTQGPQ